MLDRGLAGGFNSNITRRALKFLAEHKGAEITITTIGRKGSEFLRGRGFNVRKDWPGFFAKLNYATAETVAAEVTARFLSGEVDAVDSLFNQFVSAIAQVPNLTQLLP